MAGLATQHRLGTVERQRQALELRRAGANYDDIARQLGYANASGAFKAVQAGMKASLREPAAEVRQLEEERLDRLMLPWWRKATDPKAPDREAAEMVLKIMARRAKLLGLDAPKSIALMDDGPPVRTDLQQLTDEELLMVIQTSGVLPTMALEQLTDEQLDLCIAYRERQGARQGGGAEREGAGPS